MPLYEFRCPQGHDFEKFYRSINVAAAEEPCPVCGEIAARRISPAGLVFKGSGFYITDYGKDGKKAEREAVSAEKSKTDSSEGAAKKEATPSEGATADSKSTEKTKPATVASASTSQEKPKAAPKGKTGE